MRFRQAIPPGPGLLPEHEYTPRAAAFQLLRTQFDAVLTGTGTLEIERYGTPICDEHLERVVRGRYRET
jgi:hypothetical protein